MEATYPHKWTSKLGQPGKHNRAFQRWRQGLVGMTWAQLERGLARCSDSDDEWPPSLPKFKRYCKITPEELGLPTLEDAYRVARLQRPDWSQVHPVVYHARNLVGLDTIIEKPDSVAWPRFEKAYQALVARVLTGEVFELPVSSVPQLEHLRPRQITAPGDARVHLKTIRERIMNGINLNR